LWKSNANDNLRILGYIDDFWMMFCLKQYTARCRRAIVVTSRYFAESCAIYRLHRVICHLHWAIYRLHQVKYRLHQATYHLLRATYHLLRAIYCFHPMMQPIDLLFLPRKLLLQLSNISLLMVTCRCANMY